MHYKIRVLELGYTEHFPADYSFDGFFLAGETMFNPFSMTLIQGEGKNILIDCGFDLRIPEKRALYAASGASNGHGADEVLASAGLMPEEIDAVIITHLHWDHAGGSTCFPNAMFYLQRRELEHWSFTARNPAARALYLLSMDLNDLASFRKLIEQRRLTLLDGEVNNLFPGISIRVSAFAHSFAQQMIHVEQDAGTYLIVGDVCNRPENLLGTEEFPFFLPNLKFSVGGAINVIRDYARIMQWVNGDVDRVVMTHDGTRQGRYSETKTALGLSIYEICS
jgi:glyoxylase-like metal-dependent hydrolase (beta-lactamase superfamily II)